MNGWLGALSLATSGASKPEATTYDGDFSGCSDLSDREKVQILDLVLDKWWKRKSVRRPTPWNS